MDPVGDFDDFPDDADRESLDDVADRFFAAWRDFDDAEATKQTRRKQLRVGKLVGVTGVLAVLVAVPVILSQQPAVSSQPAPRSTVTLDQPVDRGNSADLSWHGEPGLRYAVVVAGASLATRVTFVDGQQATVPIDPGRPYCFLIQATDGRQAYETQPRAIRGAVCRQ